MWKRFQECPRSLFNYNRNTIAQFNLNIADINKVVNTAFAGQSTGMLFEGEKRFDIVVRLKGDLKKDLKDVQNLLIPTPREPKFHYTSSLMYKLRKDPTRYKGKMPKEELWSVLM